LVNVQHLPALASWRGRPCKVFAVRKGRARIRVLTTTEYYTVPIEALYPHGKLDCTLTAADVAACVPTPRWLRSAVQKLPSDIKGEPILKAHGAAGGDLAQSLEEMPGGPKMAKGAA